MQSENGNLVSMKTALDTENEALKVLPYPQQAPVPDNARALVQDLALSLSVCIRVFVWINMIVHACIYFFACVHACVGIGGVGGGCPVRQRDSKEFTSVPG